MHHLNVRVAWHDNKWDGSVCTNPSGNAFCVDLDRIRAERNDGLEDRLARKWFADLTPDQLPPCTAEAGAFMNSREWVREFVHPYQGIPKARATHGNLKPTRIKVPVYSAFAVPFNWMLRDSQEQLDESLAENLPPDEASPFDSAWVFSRHRQEVICNTFFGRLTPRQSLVFFYTKSGHPLDETISRLVVGVGRVQSVSRLLQYDTAAGPTYPMWDRLFSHSIRPDGDEGFVVPYHDYLQTTGDPNEDERRQRIVRELTVVPEPSLLSCRFPTLASSARQTSRSRRLFDVSMPSGRFVNTALQKARGRSVRSGSTEELPRLGRTAGRFQAQGRPSKHWV